MFYSSTLVSFPQNPHPQFVFGGQSPSLKLPHLQPVPNSEVQKLSPVALLKMILPKTGFVNPTSPLNHDITKAPPPEVYGLTRLVAYEGIPTPVCLTHISGRHLLVLVSPEYAFEEASFYTPITPSNESRI